MELALLGLDRQGIDSKALQRFVTVQLSDMRRHVHGAASENSGDM